MNRSHVTCVWLGLWLVLFSPGAAVLAQAPAAQTAPPSTQPYNPTVGQEGKDVVWVPTEDRLVQKMLDMARVTPADYVIDLGSGDGRTVIAAAKRGARAMGIEYNPDMVALSQRNAASAGVARRVAFVQADLFTTDFSRATVITMFLLPDINLKLRPRLLDLAPGTRVVSNTFTMAEWEPDHSETIQECESWCNALLWIVPAKVGGKWRVPEGTLALEQTFQKLSGTLGGMPIADGRMRGNHISFRVGHTRYTGRVKGDAILGAVSGGPEGSWTARRE